MKKLLLLILFLLSAFHLLRAQTILLQEDFSTASGTTPPAGWTQQTVTGDPLVDLWQFDNPGRRSPASPIAGKFACFDSDKLSNNNQVEEVYLISPVFNATTTDNIILEFDQYFQEGYGGTCSVEVFNGTSWVSLYLNSSTTTNPHHSTFDITPYVQNKTNAQVRFKWIGNYSWYWIIDNINLITKSLITDQFTEQTGIVLTGIHQSSLAWGDYDNDGNLDILLTGFTVSVPGSKIYRNNGDNSFSEQTGIVLPGVGNSSIAWGDYDNDGNLDILMTGASSSGYISKIYRNNGNNSFSEQTGIILTGVNYGSVAWGDYDNDGYLDILLTGLSSSGPISKIYRNNGDNTFTEQTGITLIGVQCSSVAWGDNDNDGDLDILLTGSTIDWPYNPISKIYRNNGNNTFTEQNGISLMGVCYSSVAWGDYDNDGYLDILLTGQNESGYISKIYRNNGNNSFNEQTGIILTGVYYSSVAWGDYDNDGNLDILMTGNTGSGSISKIFHNNGNNSFLEQSDFELTGTYNGFLAWGDYDNDSDLDILLSGQSSLGYISKIYKNNNPLKNTAPSVPGNLNAAVINQQIQFNWDKSTDLQTPQAGLSYNLVIGSTPGAFDLIAPMSNTANGFRKVVQIGNRSKLNSFTYNSSLPAGTYYWGVQAIDNSFAGSDFATGTFTIIDAQASFLKFTDITTGSAKISWTRGNRQKCSVFIKEGNTGLPSLSNNTSYSADTVFTKGSQAGAGWFCVYNGTADNVTVKGFQGGKTYKIMVKEYSGEIGHESYLTSSNSTNPQTCTTQEQFSDQTDIILPGVKTSSVAWADYNRDGDFDFLLTGRNNSAHPISIIYKNNGHNSFTEQTGIELTGIYYNSAAWGDYNNDGNLDILLAGVNSSNQFVSKIYRNYGYNIFTEQTNILLN